MTAQLTFDYLQQYQQAPASRRRICDLPTEERPLYRLHHHGSAGAFMQKVTVSNEISGVMAKISPSSSVITDDYR